MNAGHPALSVKKPLKPRLFHVFEILFLASLFLYPLFFGSTDLWGFSLATGVLCGAFSVYWFSQLRHMPVFRSGIDAWLAGYTVFFLLSLGFSKIPYLSWVELFKLSSVLCAFLATRYLCRERTQIYRTVETFVFIGALLSGIGLLQFVGGLPKDWWGHSQYISSMYVNHNHFAGLLVLLLPISFGVVLAERNKSKKILYIFMMVIMGVAFVFALSRGALLALGVAFAAMISLLKKRRLVSPSLVPFMVFVTLVVIVVVYFGTESIEQRVGNIQAMTRKEELSLQFRWLTWLGTLPMIAHYPWFGSGPGTFGHLFLLFRPSGFSMRPVHAHNDALQLLAECGVFTSLAVVLLIGVFFFRGLKILHRDESRLRIGVGSGILAGMLGLLVHALFDFNFHIPANWLLASVAGALLLTMDKEEIYPPRLSLFLKSLISVMLVTTLAGCFYLGVSQYGLWRGQRFLKERDKKSAIEVIERSLRLNPFDPEGFYLRGFIQFSDNAASSVKDLNRAIALNPYEPVYDIAKARALAPYLAGTSPGELVGLFEKALEKDPNNETLAFVVARETFGRAGPQFAPLRSLAGKMMERNPAALAGLVHYLEKSDHWQYHRRYFLKMNGVSIDENAGLSRGTSYRSGGMSYSFEKGGVLYQNAVVTKNIEVHNQLSILELECKGSAVKGVYPVLYVRIDGKLVNEHYVNSEVAKIYATALKLEPGTHLLTIEYVNDLSVGGLSRQDRNVWIQRLILREAV